ncbi:MAG: hypothetical protein JST91_08650 [Actinobacteria bacterium]|nr:hypothetical protein [Actinomycetota bacterium]
MPLAEPSDVLSRLGRAEFTPEEAALVDVRLADAERMLRRAARCDLSGIDPDDVRQVLSEMVLRLIRNVDGYAYEQDGGYAYRFNERLASGELEVTEGDLAVIGIYRGTMTVIEPSIVSARRRRATRSEHPFTYGG